MRHIFPADQKMQKLMHDEFMRQEQELTLIASENYAPLDVLQAQASVATNKYAEGYPGKRYYAGCRIIDTIEQVAIERAKQLFQAEHANVQPHAGSQANMAVYQALLEPGDIIMGMSLAEGGHLTHGHGVNFSGKLYKAVSYKVHPETELLDYDHIQQLALEHRPKLIICGASAYPRTIDFARFKAIAVSVGAYLVADIAHIAGFVATGLHPSPVPYADVVTSTTHKTLRGPRGGLILCTAEHAQAIDRAIMPGTQGGPFMHSIAAKAVGFHLAAQPQFKLYQQEVIQNARHLASALADRGYRIVTGGTDNHLMIVDLRSKNISGLQAEQLLANIGIATSRSCIPFDPAKPWITSGIRLGTPAATTRGMGPDQMQQIATIIDQTLSAPDNTQLHNQLHAQVQQLCTSFAPYNTQPTRTDSDLTMYQMPL